VPWKTIRSLFDGDQRKQKNLEKLANRLVSRSQQHEDRMAAIDELSQMRTPEATSALFRRYDVQSDKERDDRREKEYLADVLVAMGEEMLPQLREHMARSTQVVLPAGVLARVVGPERVVDELIPILEAELERLAAFKPEKKARLIQVLGEYDDPRISPLMERALADFDETVRFEAAQGLSRREAAVSGPALMARLLGGHEESNRVRGAILAALAVLAFPLVGDLDLVRRSLLPGYTVDAQGRIQKDT
jgi:HEAT repeat protein